ncbi:hypothetical protein J6590_049735 [Homalodisca vitripennis]|nr:hypothetical protein J6590_049735 [Homalodisca vitripennis]
MSKTRLYLIDLYIVNYYGTDAQECTKRHYVNSLPKLNEPYKCDAVHWKHTTLRDELHSAWIPVAFVSALN